MCCSHAERGLFGDRLEPVSRLFGGARERDVTTRGADSCIFCRDATPEGHLNKTMVELERGIEVMRTHDGDKLPLPGDP